METLLNVLPYLVGVSLAATVAVLFFGLATMSRGGDFNARYGNKIMRLRIATQATTVALLLLYFLLRG